MMTVMPTAVVVVITTVGLPRLICALDPEHCSQHTNDAAKDNEHCRDRLIRKIREDRSQGKGYCDNRGNVHRQVMQEKYTECQRLTNNNPGQGLRALALHNRGEGIHPNYPIRI